jgi:hypothetical protein
MRPQKQPQPYEPNQLHSVDKPKRARRSQESKKGRSGKRCGLEERRPDVVGALG